MHLQITLDFNVLDFYFFAFIRLVVILVLRAWKTALEIVLSAVEIRVVVGVAEVFEDGVQRNLVRCLQF